MKPVAGVDRDLECNNKKPAGSMKVYIHTLIGLAIMLIFWVIPPIGSITEIGMRVVGAFIGMVYLWSMVDTLWPSLAGIVMIGLSGYTGTGVAGFKATILNAFGSDVVVMIIFLMVLFGAVDSAGCTGYIARFLLTRKLITGRPYAFIAMFYVTCFVLSALVQPMTSLLLLWPVSLTLMKEFGIERCDKIWPYFYVGMFVASTLGQPFFPFMGAQLIPNSAFEQMFGYGVPYGPYMILNATMSAVIVGIYLLVLKFVIRPDVSKMKSVTPEKIAAQQQLPPMTGVQKAYLLMIPVYIALLLIPNFLKGTNNPIVNVLLTLGPAGLGIIFVVFFCIVRVMNKPMLDFKEVAYQQFSWGIYFMIAAAVFGANALSADVTGVVPFLMTTLNPVLGGLSETGFIIAMFTIALILTNFANNAAMAVVLMPVIKAFSEQIGIDPLPVVMGVTMMVFVAMLTPAASPHGSMMHGRKDIYTTGDILRIGFPVCVLSLIVYVCIGYPFLKMMLGI